MEKDTFIGFIMHSVKLMVIETIVILALWITLYNLTDGATFAKYIGIGVAVCFINTQIGNLVNHNFRKVIGVNGLWVIMAGLVLTLFHAGFDAAATYVAAVICISPFFGATIYECIVGLSLFITLFIYS